MAVAAQATAFDDGPLRPPRNTDQAEALARFAGNLRRARYDADLSQEDLAAEANMHRTALSRLETCERAPEFWTLIRLARALDTTPAKLLRGVR